MFFGTLAIANDGFSMVFGSPNHWFRWFSMVQDHWSNDGMVSMDRTGLFAILLLLSYVEIQGGGHYLRHNHQDRLYIGDKCYNVFFLCCIICVHNVCSKKCLFQKKERKKRATRNNNNLKTILAVCPFRYCLFKVSRGTSTGGPRGESYKNSGPDIYVLHINVASIIIHQP